jgi:hypothetical protein
MSNLVRHDVPKDRPNFLPGPVVQDGDRREKNIAIATDSVSVKVRNPEG